MKGIHLYGVFGWPASQEAFVLSQTMEKLRKEGTCKRILRAARVSHRALQRWRAEPALAQALTRAIKDAQSLHCSAWTELTVTRSAIPHSNGLSTHPTYPAMPNTAVPAPDTA